MKGLFWIVLDCSTGSSVVPSRYLLFAMRVRTSLIRLDDCSRNNAEEGGHWRRRRKRTQTTSKRQMHHQAQKDVQILPRSQHAVIPKHNGKFQQFKCFPKIQQESLDSPKSRPCFGASSMTFGLSDGFMSACNIFVNRSLQSQLRTCCTSDKQLLIIEFIHYFSHSSCKYNLQSP